VIEVDDRYVSAAEFGDLLSIAALFAAFVGCRANRSRA
jgi:hypothetical protein